MNLRKTPFPIVLLGLGLLSLGIAMIESLIVNAQSFQDLSFIGKTFTVISVSALGVATVKYLLIPFVNWIVNLVR